jgi:DNA repair photolyase
MAEILSILNEFKVHYSILSRSPYILEYIPFLNKGWCESIYFTVNAFPDVLKAEVEPRSPSFEKRIAAVLELYAAGVPVIPYCSPVLPYVSDIRFLVSRLEKLPRIEGEGLNFNVGNIDKIIEAIGRAFPHLREPYERMRQDHKEYSRVWDLIKEEFEALGRASRKDYALHVHGVRSFFENRYRG